MLVNTPISLGELVDKISILMVKQKNIKNQNKLNEVNKELKYLQETLISHINKDEINYFLNRLIDINSKLWKIEDDIRNCERNKKFDQKFIDLARNVYFTNDKRASIKLDINNTFGSELVEVKSYEEY
tara:strand:- start:162 stop:545 length:384 start_codon:yes stop_codon:yes gene_type:complete